MRAINVLRLAAGTALLALLQGGAIAAPNCKGPNKNDPGCSTTEEPAAAAASGVVDSVTVDWLNGKLVVRGSGLDTVSAFSLGGSAPLTTAGVTASALDIPFDSTVAGVVTGSGNYALAADSTTVLSVYFKSEVVDPAAGGCPCSGEWAATLPRWGSPDTACLEIEGPASNDGADIAGTVLSDPNDPSVYPQYPFGASFQPGDPLNSACQLVQVNGDATTVELINSRLNETQQADCATLLKANVCATAAPAP